MAPRRPNGARDRELRAASGPRLFDFDLDHDEPAPKPASAAPARQEARPAPTGKPIPSFRDHPCSAEGCHAWGAFGMFDGNIRTSTWWCRAHAPADFLPAARAA